jgi:germacradienol/geosmin synthase
MGILDEPPGVWDEERLVKIDLPHCGAMIHADAGPEELNLSSDWLAWGTYADDYYPLVFGRGRNLAGARAQNERLAQIMTLDEGAVAVAAAAEPANGLERGLADLWRRTAGPMSPAHREQYRGAVLEMFDSWLWELGNQIGHRIPDPVDYVEMRRDTFGSGLTIGLARFAIDDVVPPGLYDNRVLHEMETAAMDYACLVNDLFSYQKEVQFEEETHNMVLVVEQFLGLHRLAARDVVADLMTGRMQQFEHILANDLPALCDELGLDDDVRTALAHYADGLKDWMSGILEWHRRCVRYTEAELHRLHAPSTPDPAPRRPPFAPTGLGTTSTRLPTPA